MSTISAHAKTPNLLRIDSSKSVERVSHDDADSPFTNVSTPGAGKSSSTEVGVSHFLSTSVPGKSNDDGSDDEVTGFMSNYHPLPAAPETFQTNKAAKTTNLPSRTQQRLELQRREAMRPVGAVTPTTPPASSALGNMGYTFSSGSLHSRSGSRGRSRSSLGAVAGASGNIDAKAMRREYEAATKQLGVVSRFRNPLLESLNRLKTNGVLPKDMGTNASTASSSSVKRPQSRRGLHPGMNGNPQESSGPKGTPASSSPGSRVHFGHNSSARGKQPSNLGSSEDLAAFEVARPASSGAGSEDSDHDEEDTPG